MIEQGPLEHLSLRDHLIPALSALVLSLLRSQKLSKKQGQAAKLPAVHGPG